MNTFPGSIKVKITDRTGTWYATSLIIGGTPAKTITILNRRGVAIGAKYEQATQAEYDAYKARQ